jgi:hypothetical protein
MQFAVPHLQVTEVAVAPVVFAQLATAKARQSLAAE